MGSEARTRNDIIDMLGQMSAGSQEGFDKSFAMMNFIHALEKQAAADRETLDWLDEHAVEFYWYGDHDNTSPEDPEELSDSDPQPFRAAVDRAMEKRVDLMEGTS